MIRTLATEVLLFATPFVLYAVFLWATKAGVLHPASWPLSRIAALAIVALLLVIGSFLYFSHYGGAPPGSTYIPAHLDEQGNFVPGTTR
ncbi:MAG: hypothetical protein KIT76_06915 [Pseudolabrys sp.]|nr:hypothetical protein [Pseudolabrys sp.]